MSDVESRKIEPEYKDRVIFELWKLLDDIDTISDLAKWDNSMFRKLALKKAELRHDILTPSQVDQLYDRYYALKDDGDYLDNFSEEQKLEAQALKDIEDDPVREQYGGC